MNPMYVIPFILAPIVCNLIGYFCVCVIKIIPPVAYSVAWTTPGFLTPFLGSGANSIMALVIGILCLVVSTLIYLPFVAASTRAAIKKEAEEAGRPMTFCVTTFGCQMNARDSEKLRGILLEIGYEEASEEEADFVIFNTCTVRENANTRVYGRLGQLKSHKKKNPHMKIALCGCMMQEPEVVEKLRTSYRFVDLIFGTITFINLRN